MNLKEVIDGPTQLQSLQASLDAWEMVSSKVRADLNFQAVEAAARAVGDIQSSFPREINGFFAGTALDASRTELQSLLGRLNDDALKSIREQQDSVLKALEDQMSGLTNALKPYTTAIVAKEALEVAGIAPYYEAVVNRWQNSQVMKDYASLVCLDKIYSGRVNALPNGLSFSNASYLEDLRSSVKSFEEERKFQIDDELKGLARAIGTSSSQYIDAFSVGKVSFAALERRFLDRDTYSQMYGYARAVDHDSCGSSFAATLSTAENVTTHAEGDQSSAAQPQLTGSDADNSRNVSAHIKPRQSISQFSRHAEIRISGDLTRTPSGYTEPTRPTTSASAVTKAVLEVVNEKFPVVAKVTIEDDGVQYDAVSQPFDESCDRVTYMKNGQWKTAYPPRVLNATLSYTLNSEDTITIH